MTLLHFLTYTHFLESKQPHNILQKFAVANEVTGISHSEIVSTMHIQCKDSYKMLRKIASITGSWISHEILVTAQL